MLTESTIIEALEKHKGNKTLAAKSLNVPRTTFRRTLNRYLRQAPVADGVQEEDTLTELQEHKLKVEIRNLKIANKTLLENAVLEEDLLNIANSAASKKLNPPNWLTPAKPGRKPAIVCTVLSDTHYDEVVDPYQVNMVNEYNREIAVERTKVYFENVIKLSRDYVSGVNIEGLVVALAGDIVSGSIHDELKETNETSVIETSIFWSDQLAAGFELLLTHFNKIYVPCVVGNHGRATMKFKAKGFVKDNFDYLIYKILERHFKDDSRITFDISESVDMTFMVYNCKYLLTHGNQFRGGNGWMGALGPLLRGVQKKTTREAAFGNHFDVMIVGHWHQLVYLDNLIVNGTLKGTDEYSYSGNFKPEPPRQAWWLVTPDNYKVMQCPVHCKGEFE